MTSAVWLRTALMSLTNENVLITTSRGNLGIHRLTSQSLLYISNWTCRWSTNASPVRLSPERERERCQEHGAKKAKSRTKSRWSSSKRSNGPRAKEIKGPLPFSVFVGGGPTENKEWKGQGWMITLFTDRMTNLTIRQKSFSSKNINYSVSTDHRQLSLDALETWFWPVW